MNFKVLVSIYLVKIQVSDIVQFATAFAARDRSGPPSVRIFNLLICCFLVKIEVIKVVAKGHDALGS